MAIPDSQSTARQPTEGAAPPARRGVLSMAGRHSLRRRRLRRLQPEPPAAAQAACGHDVRRTVARTLGSHWRRIDWQHRKRPAGAADTYLADRNPGTKPNGGNRFQSAPVVGTQANRMLRTRHLTDFTPPRIPGAAPPLEWQGIANHRYGAQRNKRGLNWRISIP